MARGLSLSMFVELFLKFNLKIYNILCLPEKGSHDVLCVGGAIADGVAVGGGDVGCAPHGLNDWADGCD